MGVDVESFCKEHFHEIIGKVYRPFKNEEQLMLALEKTKNGVSNEVDRELRSLLEQSFHIVDYSDGNKDSIELHLGDNPTEALIERAKTSPAQLEEVLVAIADSSEQIDWIKKGKWYNLPLDKVSDMPNIMSAQRIITHCNLRKLYCKVPKTCNIIAVTSQQLKDQFKYYKEPSGKEGYLLIRLDEVEEKDID